MRNRVWGSLSNFEFKAYVIEAMVIYLLMTKLSFILTK